MKLIIYLSGVVGTMLLLFRLIGIFIEFPFNDFLLYTGVVLLLIICLPFVIIEKREHNKKIDAIISSYEGKQKKTFTTKKINSKTKGWDINNSPFRKRKSGLVWGGGNIKGATASRGTRKSFLK